MKNWKKILLWTSLIIYLIVMLVLVKRYQNNVECVQINVTVTNQETGNKFVEKNDILSILNKKKIVGEKISSINTDNIENILQTNPHVKQANVFRSNNGELEVEVTQRKAVARIINKTNISYYIDDEGIIMPLSNKYSPYVIVVNGNIDEPYSKWSDKPLTTDSSKNEFLPKLYTLIQFITNDKFWNAQIEQIYVTKNKEFELIPRVGNQTIIFGNINNYKTKFKKMKAFYDNGVGQVGWNKYKSINLKYENQVVCTKR